MQGNCDSETSTYLTQKQTDCDLDDVIKSDLIYETKEATDSMQENIQSPQLPKFPQNVLSH